MAKIKNFLLSAVALSVCACAHAPPVSQPTAVMYRAAGTGDIAQLSKANDYQINGSNVLGTTLLMVAARRNRENSVAYLLSRGASAKAVDVHSQTTLHYSLPNHNQKIDELLLKAGADPSVTDRFGVVPALSWAEDGNFDVLFLALQKREEWCCYAKIKSELREIIDEELKEKTYIPPGLFIVLKELEQ